MNSFCLFILGTVYIHLGYINEQMDKKNLCLHQAYISFGVSVCGGINKTKNKRKQRRVVSSVIKDGSVVRKKTTKQERWDEECWGEGEVANLNCKQ